MNIFGNSKEFRDENSRIEWERNNASLIVVKQNISFWEYEIDLSKLVVSEGRTKWLKDNYIYLDFVKNKSIIELTHLIDKTDAESFGMKINQINDYVKKNYQELLDLSCNFTRKDYNEYMIFSVNNNVLKLEFGDFNSDSNYSCYSYPFFRSIMELNVNKEDYSKCNFYFFRKKIDAGIAIPFIFEFPNGIKHFDYTQNPIPPRLGRIREFGLISGPSKSIL